MLAYKRKSLCFYRKGQGPPEPKISARKEENLKKWFVGRPSLDYGGRDVSVAEKVLEDKQLRRYACLRESGIILSIHYVTKTSTQMQQRNN